ncbi:hypothetical protein BGW41_003442 [Actinomortierella wolfii]|nr:hypothetical protein BGW41_003442 [Actinomortierella wolfii]
MADHHPFLHALFHSVASLGYIPFALTSTLIAISTPYVDLSPIAIILLAFTPPLTLFPLLCFSYRYLEHFTSISLTVQRAKSYIILAGCGLCLLVAIQLLLVHLVATPHNSRYNALIHTTISKPKTSLQSRPTIPPSNALQEGSQSQSHPYSQHQQQQHQHQQVLPSKEWAVQDATPVKGAMLIESMTATDDPNVDQQNSRPLSASHDTLQTISLVSTGANPKPALLDVAAIQPRHLQWRRWWWPRRLDTRVEKHTTADGITSNKKSLDVNDEVMGGKRGKKTNTEIKSNKEDSVPPLLAPVPAGGSEAQRRDKPVPIKSPIPTHLLPFPFAAPSPPQPPSLSTDDLGGPVVIEPPIPPADTDVPEATLGDGDDIMRLAMEGLQRKNDHPRLPPDDILIPVLVLGVTHDAESTSTSAITSSGPSVAQQQQQQPESIQALSSFRANIESQSYHPEYQSHQQQHRDSEPKSEDLSELLLSPHTSTSHTRTGFYSIAGFMTVFFVGSQVALIGLLTMLFLGVLILTEFILDREDDETDPQRRCKLYWARGCGIAVATVASAFHGSMLSTYVLLDGQSDWICKAVIVAIAFYWPAIITLMKRVTAPPPWEY